MDLNKFAEYVASQEGLKVALPIGQIKEVTRIVLKTLKDMSVVDLLKLLTRVR